ncbi:MAG: hypothetical protein H5T84_01335 [Thermoleophilia bacterium]|nr:hypothetical protein [Thermoleophilia bacterium]
MEALGLSAGGSTASEGGDLPGPTSQGRWLAALAVVPVRDMLRGSSLSANEVLEGNLEGKREKGTGAQGSYQTGAVCDVAPAARLGEWGSRVVDSIWDGPVWNSLGLKEAVEHLRQAAGEGINVIRETMADEVASDGEEFPSPEAKAGFSGAGLREAELISHGSLLADEDALRAAAVWSADYPSAPHWNDTLHRGRIAVLVTSDRTERPGPRGNEQRASGEGEVAASVIMVPDGVATAEMYVPRGAKKLLAGKAAVEAELTAEQRKPGSSRPVLAEAGTAASGLPPESRLGHTVRGEVVADLDAEGRLRDWGPVWVTGQAGGARGYLASLRSGVDVARSVVRFLRGDLVEPHGRGRA